MNVKSTSTDIKSKEFFDNVIDDYLARAEGLDYNCSSLIFKRRTEIVKDFLVGNKHRSNLIDFGMGPGLLADFCVDYGYNYLGIDISSQMIQKAKEKNILNAKFIVGNTGLLKKYNDSVDVFLAIGLIDYLDKPVEELSVFADCLKKDGYLIISFRNNYSLPRILRDLFKYLYQEILTINFIRPNKAFFSNVNEHSFDFSTQLLPILRSLRFNSFRTRYFNCSPFFFNFPIKPRIWHRWYKLDSQLSNNLMRFFCSGCVVLANKVSK